MILMLIISVMVIIAQISIYFHLYEERKHIKSLANDYANNSKYYADQNFVHYYTTLSGYYYAPFLLRASINKFILSLKSLLEILGIILGLINILCKYYIVGGILIVTSLYSLLSDLSLFFVYTTAHYGDINEKLFVLYRKAVTKDELSLKTDMLKYAPLAQDITNTQKITNWQKKNCQLKNIKELSGKKQNILERPFIHNSKVRQYIFDKNKQYYLERKSLLNYAYAIFAYKVISAFDDVHNHIYVRADLRNDNILLRYLEYYSFLLYSYFSDNKYFYGHIILDKEFLRDFFKELISKFMVDYCHVNGGNIEESKNEIFSNLNEYNKFIAELPIINYNFEFLQISVGTKLLLDIEKICNCQDEDQLTHEISTYLTYDSKDNMNQSIENIKKVLIIMKGYIESTKQKEK